MSVVQLRFHFVHVIFDRLLCLKDSTGKKKKLVLASTITGCPGYTMCCHEGDLKASVDH